MQRIPLLLLLILCGCAERPKPVAPVKPSPIAPVRPSPVAPSPSGSGSVRGRVTFEGALPAIVQPSTDEYAIPPLVVDPKTRAIQWAVIRVLDVKVPELPGPNKTASILMRNFRFEPHVLLIAPSTPVLVRSIEGLHHLHRRRKYGVEFDEDFKKGYTIPAKDLSEPEIIPIGCDVHKVMFGFIVVHDPRLAAITGPDGKFSIESLPAGRHKISFFHRIQEVVQEVTIEPDKTADLGDIVLREVR